MEARTRRARAAPKPPTVNVPAPAVAPDSFEEAAADRRVLARLKKRKAADPDKGISNDDLKKSLGL